MNASATASRVAVVIVSWNGRQHLAQCLPALRAQSFSDFTVFLVDSGSTDGTAAFVRAHFPEVEAIALERNLGMRMSRADCKLN